MRIAWSGARWRRRVATLCAWLAIAAAVATAARPSETVEPSGRAGILELVVDVSGSTAADDVAPTRLGAIQRATIRLLDKVPPRVRVGLVSFSDTGQTLARPTTDRGAVKGEVAALKSLGTSAIGDGLQKALNDIEASRPAAPAWVLLISDGSNTAGGSPLDAARLASAQKVPILAVALGTPDATVTVPDETGTPRQVPIPPDLGQLTGIAGATGGSAVAARSAPELETALDDLFRRTGLGSEQRDLSMLFVAAALLLLAIGRALAPSPRRRTAPNASGRPLGVLWRWTSPVALLVAAGVVAAGWVQVLPTGPPPATQSPAIADLAARPLAAPPASQSTPPPASQPAPMRPVRLPVTIDAAANDDRTIVQQAATVLSSHGMLATQRTAELKRRHLTPVSRLDVIACDVCHDSALTALGSGSYPAPDGRNPCSVLLNMPFVKRQANLAHVPLRMLMAMAMLYRHDQCMHNDHSRSVPFDAEQRLAAKLHNPLLLDLLYAQIDASRHDWAIVEQAVAILHEHGELAFQRRDAIKRHHRNQVGPLWITVCRGCLQKQDLVGQSSTKWDVAGITGCSIDLDLTGLEQDARGWGLSAALTTASTLVHEQEHCVRDPDDRETPAIDEERRLALKVGGARLLEYAISSYADLDSTGHWKS